MQIKKDDPLLSFDTLKDLERWFEKNHDKEKVLWVRFYKKSSGMSGVIYQEALDEALCYGWIDGIVKKYDDISYVQRFTPRRPKGNWSKRNAEHVERLSKEGRMRPSGVKEVEAAKKDGRWQAAYNSPANATIPPDFLKEIAKNKKANAFFESLNKSNKSFIAYQLQTAKRPETFERRKEKILSMLENGQKFM